MELACYKPGVFRDLDHFNQRIICGFTTKTQTRLLQLVDILIVNFIAVAVPFQHGIGAIDIPRLSDKGTDINHGAVLGLAMQLLASQKLVEFKAAILNARPQVPLEAMEGQTFSGEEAHKLGLVDVLVDTFDGALEMFGLAEH